MIELMNLIGTEACSHCGKLTECLSLPDDGDEPRAGCRQCINKAFTEYDNLPEFEDCQPYDHEP